MSQNIPYKAIFESNWTAIPNVIFDYWMKILDPHTFIILCYISRKTIGWRKNKENLSLNKIHEGTGISKSKICDSIKFLQEKGLVIKEKNNYENGGYDSNSYELMIYEINEESKENLPLSAENTTLSAENTRGSTQEIQGVVREKDKVIGTSHIYIKETKENKYISSSSSTPRKKNKISNENKIPKEPEKMLEFGDFVRFKEKDYNNFIKKYSLAFVEDMIERINDYCINHKPNGYKCYAAAFRNFAKNNYSKQNISQPEPNKHHSWANQFKDGEIYNGIRCEKSDKGIFFYLGSSPASFYYDDLNFESKIMQFLNRNKIKFKI